MVQSQPLSDLSLEEQFPCSDDTPVDNETQTLIPTLLLEILKRIWSERTDWFLGIDMGIYDNRHQSKPAVIVPDAFLSLEVPRRRWNKGRSSYILSLENNIPPRLVLEVVSQTPGNEYDEKMKKYAQLGVLYYVIENSEYYQRDRHEPFEVYRLESGKYVRQLGNPVWLPEVGLGIGREIGTHYLWEREWVYWYDQDGNRFLTSDEVVEEEKTQRWLAQQAAELAQQEAQLAQQEAQTERRRREELEALLERYRQQLGDLED